MASCKLISACLITGVPLGGALLPTCGSRIRTLLKAGCHLSTRSRHTARLGAVLVLGHAISPARYALDGGASKVALGVPVPTWVWRQPASASSPAIPPALPVAFSPTGPSSLACSSRAGACREIGWLKCRGLLERRRLSAFHATLAPPESARRQAGDGCREPAGLILAAFHLGRERPAFDAARYVRRARNDRVDSTTPTF